MAKGNLRASQLTSVDPILYGLQVTILAKDGTEVITAALPAGSYGGSGTKGWTATKRRSKVVKWSYRDTTGALTGSISRVEITIAEGSTSSQRELTFTVQSGNGSFLGSRTKLPYKLGIGMGTGGRTYCASELLTSRDCSYTDRERNFHCE